jgi:tetratricopeptide (TPR) repeat protein
VGAADQPTPATPPTSSPNAPAAQAATAQPTDVNLSELIRSYLALRDQLQAVQLAMLQQRLDAEVASRNQTTAVAEKFEAIRSALESEREFRRQESQRAQEERDRLSLELAQFQRTILWLAGALAALGLLVAAVRLWLTARRARAPQPAPQPPAPPEPARTVNAPAIAPVAATPPPAPEPVAPPPPRPVVSAAPEPVSREARRFPDHDPLERLRRDPAWIAGLLSQGNSLLMENRSREALSCFEELLQLDPTSSEAWMKRGLALERLQQLESALRSFDQALALEPGLAAAHLYRAGLCTRMRRFDDAAESYRQAARGSAPVNPGSR